jgi:hypothetical protein
MEKEGLSLMALLPPILHSGMFYGNNILRATQSYVSDVNITQPFGVLVGFYSPSGEYVGSISSSPSSAGYIKYKLTAELNYGLRDFSFQIARNVTIPFYTGMEVRFYITGKLWFTGELIFQPSQDKRKPVYTYEGKGFWSHLKKDKISNVWQNKSPSFITKDIIQHYVEPNTRIIYDPTYIVGPDILLTYFEAKNKYPLEVLEDLLAACNYDIDTMEYHMGVNNERQFFLLPLNQDVNYGFFEGFQYQEPDTKIDIKGIINYIEIFRTKQADKDTEYVSTIQDLDSQEKWGVQAADNFTIASYIDTTTAERIARAKIDQNKDAKTKIAIKDLNCLGDPYPFEYYHLNNRRNQYIEIVDECELLSDWNIYFSNTSISTSGVKVFSGLKSFKIETINGSKGEYLEYILENEINYPNQLRAYFSQSDIGKVLKFHVYDINDNVQTFEHNIRLIVDFQTPIMNITLENIKRVRVEIVTNGSYTIYLDRLDVIQQAYKQHRLKLNKIDYELDKNTLLAVAEFGDKIDNLLDDIKNIKDGQDNLYNIFQRNV